MGNFSPQEPATYDLCLIPRPIHSMSVVVFLRDDIYQMLQFERKNKITENNVSTVEWDLRGDSLTLRALMERRFGEVFYRDGTAAWNEVFDDRREMPGRQSKYKHICDRTFLRPRDMIKCCNEVLSAYKDLHPNWSAPARR